METSSDRLLSDATLAEVLQKSSSPPNSSVPPLKKGTSQAHENISIYYVNADCLSNKVNELIALAVNDMFDIICITETLPKFCINPMMIDSYTFAIPNYDCYHCITGRGISVYVHNQLKSEQIILNADYNDSVWISLDFSNSEKVIIGCIYRSPSSSDYNNEQLLHMFNKTKNLKFKSLVIVGDFNLKEIDWRNFHVHTRPDHIAVKVFDSLNDLFLEQLVNEPTRHRQGEQANLLDWVITDNKENIEDLVVGAPLGAKGDHNSITFRMRTPNSGSYQSNKLNLYKGDYEAMSKHLESIPWNRQLHGKSCSESWEYFHNVLLNNIREYIPLSIGKARKPKTKLWVDTAVKTAVKDKNRAWNVYKKNKSEANWKSFTVARNNANKVVIKSKSNFELKIANEIKKNPKQFWHYVKTKAGSNRDFPNLIDDEGVMHKTDLNKAELFNKYFASVFTREDTSAIPDPNFNTNNEISSIEITPDTVVKYLNKINISKAAGPDGFHSKILFEIRESLKVPLSLIYNKSINEGILPDMWKHANVKPLFKKGDRKLPSNYRPVSLTSICCKTLERIIRDNIIKYLERNELFNHNQHGFRSGRSCVTQLLEIMEIWTDLLDKGIPYDCVYLDFAKAFDKVPHRRLVRKIEAHGIKGKLLKWLTNFLANRTQSVMIHDQNSGKINVTSGIPQGSVLGPTLFLLYINDISESTDSWLKIFADDTKIFRAITNQSDNLELQADLDRLLEWTVKWQLPFNIAKCKVIHYGTRNPNYKYILNNTDIQEDTTEKDLGITFDNNLKFSSHIRLIVAKANSRVGILRRNFSYLEPIVFLPLYKALVRPILEYGSVIWNPLFKSDQEEIEKVQRRATKLVTSISHLPYNMRLKTLKLDSLKFRRRRSDILQVFRILKGIDNINPNNFFSLNPDIRTRGHSLKLTKIRANSNKRLNAFTMRIINDWNNLKEKTISCSSLNSFKTALKHEWSNHPDRYLD